MLCPVAQRPLKTSVCSGHRRYLPSSAFPPRSPPGLDRPQRPCQGIPSWGRAAWIRPLMRGGGPAWRLWTSCRSEDQEGSSVLLSQCDCSCVPWAIQGFSALGECDSVTLHLQRVVTGAGRLRGPGGGKEGTFGKPSGRRAEGEGWGVNSSLEGVLFSWRGLLGSSSKANSVCECVCVLVNWCMCR